MSRNRKGFRRREKPEYDQKLVHVARVARMVAGGRRFRFRACVVIGNRKGKVGMGLAKGADVTTAVGKAVEQAKKKLIEVPTELFNKIQELAKQNERSDNKQIVYLLKKALALN